MQTQGGLVYSFKMYNHQTYSGPETMKILPTVKFGEYAGSNMGLEPKYFLYQCLHNFNKHHYAQATAWWQGSGHALDRDLYLNVTYSILICTTSGAFGFCEHPSHW